MDLTSVLLESQKYHMGAVIREGVEYLLESDYDSNKKDYYWQGCLTGGCYNGGMRMWFLVGLRAINQNERTH